MGPCGLVWSEGRKLAVLGVLVLCLAAPGLAQPPNPPPHQVTPWEPVSNAPGTVSSGQAPAPPPPLSTSVWTAIGPTPLATSSPANANSNVSGRIAAVAAHPTDPNTIYIAAAGGGVWKTTNGGSSWIPLTDQQSSLSMGAIAVASINPNFIYAGTGEANNSEDSNYGRGILISHDGGTSWILNTGPGGVFDRLTTSQIAVDPADPNIAYAAMADFGNNGVCCANTGVWKTTDGGTNWTNISAAAGLNSQRPWSALVIDPNSHLTIYAAIGEYDGFASNGLYKSTNGGATWSALPGFPSGTLSGRIAIAISKANSLVVYVSSSSPSTFGLFKFMRSDNGGASFIDLTAGTPNYMGGQGWYDTWIAVDPLNAAIVYVGGASGTNSILRSINSGVSWTDIHTGGAPNFTSPHVDHHGVDFDANGKLLDGDDGGIYRLDTPTTPSWSDLNGNLGTIQFTGIGLHPTDPTKVIGGSQDNGTEIFNNDSVWTETDGGDGGYAKFNPTNGSHAYHQIPVDSFGTNFFRFSSDGGNTWTTRTSSISGDTTQNFYAPFSVDPGNGSRVLYGTTRVWETTNEGISWTPISNVGSNGFTPTGNVDAIGIAPSDIGTVYAATGGEFAASTKIFVTTTHGVSWTEHDLPAGSGRVNDIQVDRLVSQTAYAVTNTFTSGAHVFKTTNGGTTWTSITGNLPNQPVWSIQIDNANNRLFVAADDGVYATTNGGTTWNRFGAGFPNVQTVQLDLNPALNILGAATHGRGAWEISTVSAAVNVTGQFTISNFAVGFNRVTGKWTQNVSMTNNGPALSNAAYVLDNLIAGWTLTNGDGNTVATTPTGSPYKIIGAVGAGATVTFQLQFTRAGTPAFGYTARVLEGTSR